MLSDGRQHDDASNGVSVMVHDTKGDLLGLLESNAHYLTRCFRITRKDGTVYRITDHDNNLSFPDAWLDNSSSDKVADVETYSPADGWDASNARTESAMKKNNIEMKGAFGGSFVTDDDILAGLWDWAIVDDFICDWRYPFKGAMRWNKYRLTDFQLNDDVWIAQANNMTSELYRKSGKTYGDTCWHAFGDAHCGIDLTVAGVTEFHCTVDALHASPDHNRSLSYLGVSGSYDGANGLETDYFKAGHVRWTTGNNKGQVYPIRKSLRISSAAVGMIYLNATQDNNKSIFIKNTDGITWTFAWDAWRTTGERGTSPYYVYVSNTGTYISDNIAELKAAINMTLEFKMTASNVDDVSELPSNFNSTSLLQYLKLTQKVHGENGNTTITGDSNTMEIASFGQFGLQTGYGENITPSGGVKAVGAIEFAQSATDFQEGDYIEITDYDGLTWKFIFTFLYSTGTSAGTQQTYVKVVDSSWFTVAYQFSQAIGTTALKVNMLDAYSTNTPKPTSGGSHNGMYVILEQMDYGTSGNTSIVSGGGGTSSNEFTLTDFGTDGLPAGEDVDLNDGGDIIYLQYPTRADVQAGDAFTLFAGCDKLLATCKDVTLAGGVNNKDNFGGFPFLVGTSKLVKTGGKDAQ